MVKRVITHLALAGLSSAIIFTAGCSKPSGLDPDLARFVADKRVEVQQLAKAQTNEIPEHVWRFFDAVQQNDFRGASNWFEELRVEGGHVRPVSKPVPGFLGKLWAWVKSFFKSHGLGAGPPSPFFRSAAWPVLVETYGTFEQFNSWDSKWLHRFGRDVISSIPTNSIYFGGTDPGRFIISALSESQREGRPFFTVTQNQFADGTYLECLRTIYGAKLYIPTAADMEHAFQDYIKDAQHRYETGKLRPGEDFRMTSGRVQVSGQVAVMDINGRIAKILVEKNPDHEFYVEESFPLDWMYPQLSPHGLILKLNPNPLPELNEDVVRKDRDYWNRYVKELIGENFAGDTTVNEACDFVKKVYVEKYLAGFKGDPTFLKDEAARKCYSKLRSSIGGLYVWRAKHAKAKAEEERMRKEADLAFNQAFALCPTSPEAVFRYVNLLLDQDRQAEAMRIAELSLRLDPLNAAMHSLADRLSKPGTKP